MSLIQHAKDELKRVNFGDEDSEVMIAILEKFFDQWDSGGAVHAVAPVLQRLIAGKCLSPLTGAPDEWFDHGGGVLQNKRCGTVFMDPRFHDGKLAYDLDNPAGPREAIVFPYWPERAEVASPIVVIETGER
jgi:hypothetical protein